MSESAQTRASGTVEPRGRRPLVFATMRVLAESRPIVGDVVVENAIAQAIVGGRLSRKPIAGLEKLASYERYVLPHDVAWAGVVRRGPGKLVHRRTKSCWHIVRIVVVPGGES